MGNIVTYTDANGTVTYTYDDLGQLTKAEGTETYEYSYDNAGNILSGNGHSYTYGDSTWADLLTAVDGQTITYDAIGNPTGYYNGTSWSFTWARGRQLATASNGTDTVSYTYDADGLRTSKTVNGTVHTYYYAGSKLLRETYGSNTLDFFYDASGNSYALKYNGTLYYYITNLQGDVMSIVDAQGEVVAEYEYDPYGNILAATGSLADVNPLRYRGYVYDTETQFYYLQSRYYDPELGRFLNADSYVSTGQGVLGYNMFAYCGNSPIIFSDPHGNYRSLTPIVAPHNPNREPKYIVDQEDDSVGEKPYGVSTVSFSGCGAIATFNALVSLGECVAFDEVLEYYNSNLHRLNVMGLAGTKTSAVAGYFRDKGYTVVVTDDQTEMDLRSKGADACILFYMFPDTYYPFGIPIDAYGAHFIEYSRSENGYIGRNTAEENGTYQFSYPSDYGYMGDRFYAVGIYIYKPEE